MKMKKKTKNYIEKHIGIWHLQLLSIKQHNAHQIQQVDTVGTEPNR